MALSKHPKSSPLKSSPLPKAILALLVPICVFHDMDITMVFSFLPKMIKSFGTSEVWAGYYTGMIGSSMYIGFLLCSLLWSYLADIKGRKFSILASSSLLAASVLAFGFSRTFTWAMLTRFLQGCSFGAVNVSKSILREHLDDSNMALGMAIIVSTGTIGLVLGPAFAGITVYPCEQYPAVFSSMSFLREFPVFLPNAAISLCLLVTILFTAAYMPDSKAKQLADYRPVQTNDAELEIEKSDVHSTSDDESDRGIRAPTTITNETNPSVPTSNSLRLWNQFEDWKCVKILKMRDCILSCVLYGLLGFSATAFHTLFPLLASTSIQYHGMAMSTSKIGLILLVVSGILLFIQIPLLSKTINLLGAKKTFCLSSLVQGILIPFLPALAQISNRVSLLTLLCCHLFLYQLLVQASFLSVTVLMNNSSTSELSATVNGLGFTFAALGRFLSPLTFGPLYSWSLTNINSSHQSFMSGFPLNQYFSFLLWALVALAIACVGTMVSRKADRKNDSPVC